MRIPTYVAVPGDVDADRVLIAGWLYGQGEHQIAFVLTRSITDTHVDLAERTLREIAELLARYELVSDDPERYIGEFCDDRPTSAIRDWMEMEQHDLLVEAIALARTFAEWADPRVLGRAS